jgi:hypothetical protein
MNGWAGREQARVNVVVSWGAGASNDVGHTRVTLWLLGVTDSFAHSLVGLPSSSKVIAPDAPTLMSAVTVAIRVTVSLVTAAVGEAREQSYYRPTSVGYWRKPPPRSDDCTCVDLARMVVRSLARIADRRPA